MLTQLAPITTTVIVRGIVEQLADRGIVEQLIAPQYLFEVALLLNTCGLTMGW